MVKIYLRNKGTLKKHIKLVAFSSKRGLEKLLTALVFLYTKDFLEEKERNTHHKGYLEDEKPEKLFFYGRFTNRQKR